MTEVIIDTAKGKRSPFDALQLLKTGRLDSGGMVGVLNALSVAGVPEAREAAEHIVGRADQYRDHVVAKAHEVLGGGRNTSLSTRPQQVKDAAQLAGLVQNVGAGTRLCLRFKLGGFPGLTYLSGMAHAGLISISGSDQVVMAAVNTSRDWGADQNRNLTVKVLPNFKADWFSQRLYREIEAIEILPAIG